MLEENGQIVFRYCDKNGEITDSANPNGARSNIAGICNQDRNVLGMMPHPERACEELLGSNDGRDIFRSLTNGHSSGRSVRVKASAANSAENTSKTYRRE